MGQLTVVSPQEPEASQAHAPQWFSNLGPPAACRPRGEGGCRRRRQSRGHRRRACRRDRRGLAGLLFARHRLARAQCAHSRLLYVVLGRVLDPLQNLSSGMARLEDGHYATRLATPKVKELAVITNRFNTLAGALDIARDENSGLYRQLITVQEEERREIANELHDEAGPCLFGITANASSIQTIADQLTDPRTAGITHRVGEILGIIERLKLMNRALLKKLRPGSHGRVGLAELINELVAGFERRHPDTHIALFGRKAGKILRRADRPHALSLRPGRHHQCHPARLGRQSHHRPRRGERTPAQRREAGPGRPSPHRRRRRQGNRSVDAEGLRPHHHDRAREIARRNLRDRERARQRHHHSHRNSGATRENGTRASA